MDRNIATSYLNHSAVSEVIIVPTRIPWNQHEVALLIDAHIRVAEGADLGQTAERLSHTLRSWRSSQ